MPTAPHPLRIAILGAGRIGSAFAFQLARTGGHDVTVIARPGSVRLAQLERDQAIVDVEGERAPVQVAGRLDEATPYDLIIVTVLAHQVPPLLPALQRSAAGCIQFMANTFAPERWQAAIGRERCAFGMPFVQANMDGDGRLKVVISAGGQKTLMGLQRWVDVFNAAGLPSALEPDMPLWLRCHVPLCVAFESVSVAGERRGGGASWGEAMILARGVHASFALIASLGYDIYPKAKKRLRRLPIWVTALVLWTVSRIRPFRVLLATGRYECCALIDAMLSFASPGTAASTIAAIAAMKPS
ncbi:MAG: ketopantoate reductase family protein [Caulobacteraceae bacterium]